jgi:cytosine/adenosine deaminase-related metal-dependent hydrolase
MPGLLGALRRGLIAGAGLLTLIASPAFADGDYTVFIAGLERGEMTVRTDRTGLRESGFRFVDRGRGPETTTRLRVDADGLPILLSVEGVSYYKTAVAETASRTGDLITWKSEADSGSGPAGTFYLANQADPEISAALARALIKAPGGELTLLPGGKARIEGAGERTLQGANGPVLARLYLVSGLGYDALPLWLDSDGELLAEASSWVSVTRKDLLAAIPELIKAQDEVIRARAVAQAATLGRKPTGPVAFKGVRLYDAKGRVFRPDMTVIVRGDRIEAVGRARSTKIPAGAEVIEGRGMTLLPGLFDMHVHLSRDSGGLIDIATGVTSVRDLANDPDDLAARKASFDSGELIGPRVFMAGIIDGKGPLAGPTKALVDTPEDARRVVADWADRGYPQVKLYSSIKPELMPVLIEAAKTRGLRISGHVPAGMTMQEVVLVGYDEVQHANFWILNFLGPEVAAKTNSPVRFTAVGEQGAALDLASPEVKAFVELLRKRGIVLDPTMAAMEDALTGRRGVPSPSLASVADRLPPVVRRGIAGSGFARTEEERARFVQSWARMGQFLKLLHDQGVPIVAGTDGGAASLTLVHELELYVAAGLSPADALYTATLGAAKVARADDRLGSIEPGKVADLLLVQGDPSRNMGDLRKGVLVLKDGVVFEPDALYGAVGIAPSRR